MKKSLFFVAMIAVTSTALAKKTHSYRAKINTPEQQLAGFSVPDGYVVELVASERDGVINPIDLTFDNQGRLWTQTARMYPLDPVKDIKWNELLRLMDNPKEQDANPEFKRIKDLYQGKTKGTDEVLILSDLYKEGGPNVMTFASGLTIPQSILPFKNGAYIAQGSELFYLKDENNDGKSDKRFPILTGFGFTDTHTMSHTLVRGPGGWIHFSQGALNKGDIKAVASGNSARIDYSKIARFSTDGKKIEVINAGLNNIWGFQLRGNGQWFMTEANDYGMSVVPAEPYTGYKGIGKQKLRAYQPFLPILHKFRVGGTGISGLAFADDPVSKFHAEFKDVAFLANPITSKINCVKIVRNPDGSVTAKHLPDFLTSKDDWFRPVNIEFGPDGCLYIADWHNKIVSHNELPTTHPDRDKKHGRIWRVRHKSQQSGKIPNLAKMKLAGLLESLRSPSLWIKRRAAFEIADRNASTLAPKIEAILLDPKSDSCTMIHALWTLENMAKMNPNVIQHLLKSNDGNVRREAIRSLASFKPSPAEVASILKPFIYDKNVMVRSQLIRTLEQLGAANNETIDILVSFCRPAAPNNVMGGNYERNFERYLARRALEKYTKELKKYINSPLASKQAPTNLVWAMQSLGKDAAASFIALYDQIKDRELALPDLIVIAQMAKNRAVFTAVEPTFKNVKKAEKILTLALSKVEDLYTPALAKLLEHPCVHLLNSTDTTKQELALDALIKLRINTTISPSLIKKLMKRNPELTIKALSVNPARYRSILAQLVMQNQSVRLSALDALAKVDLGMSSNLALSMLKKDTSLKSSMIFTLSNSTHGTNILLKLLNEKLVSFSDLNYDIADRVLKINPKNPTAQRLHKHAEQAFMAKKKKAVARIPALMKLEEAGIGDEVMGKAFFNSCLVCHSVGEKGNDFAPKLDGSANREAEAVLTALLDPDAAAEGAYILHRVITKLGDIHEGYLVRKDGRGVVLAKKNGSQHFFPSREVAVSEFVGSRSFMPADIVSELPDEMIASLLKFIRTLE